MAGWFSLMWVRLFGCAAAGGVATLGFAPFGWWPLTLLAMLALLVAIRGQGPGRTALLGFAFGLTHFTSGIYWVFYSTVYYGNAAPWLGVVLVCLLAAVLALFPAVLLWFGRWLLPSASPVWPLAVGTAWTASELIRGTVLEGFPWLATGYAFADTAMHGWAPVLGVHGMSWLLWSVVACVVALLWQRRWLVHGLPVLAVVVSAWVLPAPSSWTEADGPVLDVALIQGNVAQADKWRDSEGPRIAGLYERMTDAALGADLVVWPEVAVPYTYPQIRNGYLARIGRRAADAETAVVLGTLIPNDERTQMLNSVVGIGATEGTYLKRHLVPFGEVFPLPDFMRPLLDVVDLRFANLDTGDAGQPHFPIGQTAASISICFEDVFGDEIAREARGSGLLVNVTNDAWFHDSTAAPQHLQIARMRSVETARPMLKVAQTGITAIIGPDGEIQQQVPQFQVATLRGRVQPVRGQTPYMRWDDRPLWWGSALLGLALLVWRLAAGRCAAA